MSSQKFRGTSAGNIETASQLRNVLWPDPRRSLMSRSKESRRWRSLRPYKIPIGGPATVPP